MELVINLEKYIKSAARPLTRNHQLLVDQGSQKKYYILTTKRATNLQLNIFLKEFRCLKYMSVALNNFFRL